VRHYMVELGGEVRTRGKKDGEVPWKIGIERPDAERGVVQEIVVLENQALATSGDYRNYREVNDVRISHTIDARTGLPIQHSLASVSVVASSAMEADAWATALNVMGAKEGMALAREEGMAVMMLRREGDGFETEMTEAFEALRVTMDTNPNPGKSP